MADDGPSHPIRGNAIGFYPADENLAGAPGWYHNSFGYHADEGCRYHRTPLPQFPNSMQHWLTLMMMMMMRRDEERDLQGWLALDRA